MSLNDKIMNDYKEAFKAKDTIKKEILNYIIAQMKYKKIEIQKDLQDDDIISVIKKEIKTRKESIDYLQKVWNTEEIDLENSKIKIMESYLPQMMPIEQLIELVKKIMSELWITDKNKQRWQIISAVMKDHKWVVDWQVLNEIINNI